MISYSQYLQALAYRDQFILTIAAISVMAVLLIALVWRKYPGLRYSIRLALVGGFYLLLTLALLGVLH